MIRISLRTIMLFFIMISLVYILSPVLGVWIFGDNLQSVPFFVFASLLLLFLIIIAFYCVNPLVLVKTPLISPVKTPLIGLLLFGSLLSALIHTYGSIEQALFVSYISRTGVQTTGIVKYIFYPVITFATAYVSLSFVSLVTIPLRQQKFYFIITYVVSIFIIMIFAMSGNRNCILWSLATPIAIFVGRVKVIKIFFLTALMIFISVIMAAFRNTGVDNLQNFSFPSFENWNPMIQEYATTYKIYIVLTNDGLAIHGYEFPLASYVFGLVNFLPSFIKPANYISFSNAISTQLAKDGEGIGNSPVGEVIYNGVFPAIFFQLLPFFIILYCFNSKRFQVTQNYKINIIKLALLGCMVIMSFNFWRIGFAELVKILLSYIVAYIVCGKISFNKVIESGGGARVN